MQELQEFLEEVIEKYDVHAVLGRPESVRIHGDIGEFVLVWHFTDHIPEGFEYAEGNRTVTYQDKSITCRFECVVAETLDYWIEREEPHFFVADRNYDGEIEVELSTFEKLVSENVISGSRFADIIETLDEDDLVELVTVSAETTERGNQVGDIVREMGESSSQSEDKDTVVSQEVQFTIVLSPPHHFEIESIRSDWRFDHVQALDLPDGGRIPVSVQTELFPESEAEFDPSGPHGQPVHTGGSVTEFTDTDKVHFRDELERIDFQALIEEDSLYPDEFNEWPGV